MRETQEIFVTYQNGQNPYLKNHRQQKRKENIGGNGLGLQRGRKAIPQEVEKQMFGKQVFAGPCRGNGTQHDGL